MKLQGLIFRPLEHETLSKNLFLRIHWRLDFKKWFLEEDLTTKFDTYATHVHVLYIVYVVSKREAVWDSTVSNDGVCPLPPQNEFERVLCVNVLATDAVSGAPNVAA